MQLVLIRHALPERVVTTDGTPADPGLSELGRGQALALADWLAAERIDAVYSSPMLRARQTAEPLAQRKDLEIQLDERLSEFDRDSTIYIPMEELKQTDYEAWLQFVKSGYPADLDVEAFYTGVVGAIEAIVAANSGATVAVVCHGGVINAWAVHILEIPRPLFFGPRYTSINRFMGASSGQRSLESLNEVPHL